MKRKLGILHTTAVTIDPLKSLAQELIPDCEVFNMLDDSILKELIENRGDLASVEQRVFSYIEIAAQNGADLILGACSSIGGLMHQAQALADVPVLRIDDAMAEHAVQNGKNLAVVATLFTTLSPTVELLQTKANELGPEISVTPHLVKSAYEALVRGDLELHDSILASRLREIYFTADLVVLAQASMARVTMRLPDLEQSRFVTSPRLGMEEVRRILSR